MATYRWVQRALDDTSLVARLQRQLNDLPEPLARALALRGIQSFDQARTFFRPQPDHLHDPFVMQDMRPAADRLARAIQTGERVLVYGDYDVDGTTATALMYTFLKDQGVDAAYYVPDRFEEGYGLNETGIDAAVTQGIPLMITLDCGITANAAADYARSKGIDLIIGDHHTPGATLPDAVAVLNPKRRDCPYPFKELSGCGVGYKLVEATLDTLGKPREAAHKYLDLLALSIASDIVPILGENRVLMRMGLDRLRTAPRLGLRKLAEQAGLDLASCNTSRIVFSLGPRINAAGRLGDAKLAVELMIAEDEGEAQRLAAELESINLRRREFDATAFDEAVEQIENSYALCAQNAIVLHGPEWHIGVVGIVASRLVDRYYKPTVLLSSVNGEVRGSARSVSEYNIYNALKQCEGHLTRFGGHAFAAGVTLEPCNVEAFAKAFNEVVADSIEPEQTKPIIEVDALLDLMDISSRFWAVLKQFAPFGPHNMEPVFHGRSLRSVGQPAIVGNGHLKFRVAHADDQASPVMDVIGFNQHEHWPTVRDSVRQGRPFQMLFTVNENTWNGRTTLQLQAKDIRTEDA